jgi:hypothetical protein
MQLALGMASHFHTPVNYWLDMPLTRLGSFAEIAMEAIKKQKEEWQEVGPGL